MNLKDQLDALLDATAFDSTGTKIGAVRQVYVDDASGRMTFATVSTGIFSADAIVPLHGARLLDDELHVAHTRSEVRDSPRPDHTEDGLTPDQESRLLEHYGVETPTSDRGETAGAPAERPRAADTVGATRPRDDDDDAADAAGTKRPRDDAADAADAADAETEAEAAESDDDAAEAAEAEADDNATEAAGDNGADGADSKRTERAEKRPTPDTPTQTTGPSVTRKKSGATNES